MIKHIHPDTYNDMEYFSNLCWKDRKDIDIQSRSLKDTTRASRGNTINAKVKARYRTSHLDFISGLGRRNKVYVHQQTAELHELSCMRNNHDIFLFESSTVCINQNLRSMNSTLIRSHMSTEILNMIIPSQMRSSNTCVRKIGRMRISFGSSIIYTHHS